MRGNHQMQQWRRPGFWDTPQVTPQLPMGQRPAQPTQSQPKQADQAASTTRAGAGDGAWRRAPEGRHRYPLPGRFFDAGAVSQYPEHGDGQHQPVAGHAGGLGTPGRLPLPAHPFQGPEAQLDPDPQPLPAYAHARRGYISQHHPGRALVGCPHHDQRPHAAYMAGPKGHAAAHPGRAGAWPQLTGPAAPLSQGLKTDRILQPQPRLPAQLANLLPQAWAPGLPGAAEQKSTGSRPVCWTPEP